MYTPRRKDEPELWTRGKLRWAWDAMKRTVDGAIEAQAEKEEVRAIFSSQPIVAVSCAQPI